MSEFIKAKSTAWKQLNTGYDKGQRIRYRQLSTIESYLFTAENNLERYPYPLKSTIDSDTDTDNSKDDNEQNCLYQIEQLFLSRRIRIDQQPAETMLELLMAFSSLASETTPAQIKVDQSGQVTFSVARQARLRRILFNNPYLEFFNNQNNTEDSQKWQQWGDTFIKSNLREIRSNKSEDELQKSTHYQDMLANIKTTNIRSTKSVAAYRIFTKKDIDKLKQGFDQDFNKFTKAVLLLRSWAFIHPGKQWCYNFLFPFGPDCLFMEMKQDHSYSGNYLSGAGLLVFNMMWRAHNSDHFVTVCRELHQRFLNSNNVFNQIARKLEGMDTGVDDMADAYSPLLNRPRTGKTSYLPYRQHRVFDQVTEDFYNLLTLKIPLNQQDLFKALSLICTLNLIVYYLEICQTLNSLNGINSNIDMVVECCHEQGRNLRNLSTSRLNGNDDLWQQVVDKMFVRYLQEMFPDYTQSSMLKRDEFNQIIEILSDTFDLGKNFNQDGKAFEQCCESESGDKTTLASFKQLQKYLLQAVAKGGSHINNLHRVFCRYIGLSSYRLTRAYRYVLPDELVRVLVLTTVDKRHQLMLLDTFLQELYRKYHLVIGPKESKNYLVSEHDVTHGVEDSLFIANLEAFKEQLLRMGFLITLSDTASYIKNPYLD